MEEKSTGPGDVRSASFWRSLFDDISVAQLIAGALAAVTSMLLASRIGIAGSVIGVAVGSVVSAVASQVYKKFLSASAEKLKDMAPDRTVFARRVAHPRSTDCGEHPVSDAAKTAPAPTMPMRRCAETLAADPRVDVAAAGADTRRPRSLRSQAYADEALARSRAARARKARIQRNAVIVAAVSALAAIALTACVIEAVTAGQGFGAKPDPVFYASHDAPAADRDPAPDSAPSRTSDAASAPSAPSGGSAQEDPSSQETPSEGPSAQAPDDRPAPFEPSVPFQTPPASPDGDSSGSGPQDQGDASQGETQDSAQGQGGVAPHGASGQSTDAAALFSPAPPSNPALGA